MRFKAKVRRDKETVYGKALDVLLVSVKSVQEIRGMLVVKFDDETYTYNSDDLAYWEVVLD